MMQNATEQFRDAIRAAGLTPPDTIYSDGKLRRFAGNGNPRDDSGWYVFHDDALPAGAFGCWRSDLAQKWRADIGRKLTPTELAAQRGREAALQRARDADEAQRREQAATKARSLWKAAAPAGTDHPYLIHKGVAPVATLRELPSEQVADILGYPPKARGEVLVGRLLIVPIMIGSTISSVEFIDETGRKSALAGGAKRGGYWAPQSMPKGDGAGLTVLIAEGVATALSAREATGHHALAALSCGNLVHVARAMRQRYPAARLVILADLGNGEAAAEEAARDNGAYLAQPHFGADRPDDATDFNDLMRLRGREAVERAVANARAPDVVTGQPTSETATATDSGGWPEPLPLVAKVAPEPYPIDALPETIRKAVEEVQGFTKAPVPMVASSALAALSLAAQAYCDVQRTDKLQGPIALFLLTIADSGERKSTCDGFFTKAICDYEKKQAEVAKPILKNYMAEIEAWDAKHSGIKDKLRQLAKNNKPTSDMELALRDLEHDKPESPRIPRLLYTDATPEALAYGLAKQWPSGGVVSAEAGIVFGSHGMGKDSVMRNLGLLNQLWDGTSLTIDRRTSQSFTVRGARLTVALQVQEPTLREFFVRTGALARGTGFLARFLVAWPESTQGFRPFTEAPPNWPHLAAFHQRIAAILANPVLMDDDGALSPALLTLAPEAKRLWIAFHDAIESRLRMGGELFDVRDVASKIADNAVRLAALFHAFGSTSSNCSSSNISKDDFEGASRVAVWHLNEARRFFGELALPLELANAARLDTWLLDYCRREHTTFVPTRKVQQFGPGGLREKSTIVATARDLEELGRVRLLQDGRRRDIRINPALLNGTTA